MQIASTEGLLKLAATSAGVNLINIQIADTDKSGRIAREFSFLGEDAVDELCEEAKVTLVFDDANAAIFTWGELMSSRRELAKSGTYIAPIIHCVLQTGEVRRYEDGNVTRGEIDG